ncbi:hypothetical protein SMC26_07840 [Actinomadura fulvescens]|uniref:DUF2867 domain-containing protein n=1 Tax=Actinomadura fulvescens TaxID=46160 RepID=A0ABP6C6Y8_9ACTN
MKITTTETTVVQQHELPAAIRATSPITDYADAFTLVASDAGCWTPEQWARALFEDVAALMGQFVWRVLLGLRLRWRRSVTSVAGWRIAERGDGWIRLEARGWMLTGHLVVHIETDRVTLATFIRYDRRIAARVWTTLSRVHRDEASGLLRDALKTLRA